MKQPPAVSIELMGKGQLPAGCTGLMGKGYSYLEKEDVAADIRNLREV